MDEVFQDALVTRVNIHDGVVTASHYFLGRPENIR